MRYWLRGKRGGLVGFLAIAALVLGGLGWVTDAVLRLEEEKIQKDKARAAAERLARLRLALWRLDSFILPDLSREDSRPYYDYSPHPHGVADPADKTPALVRAELPDWIMLHFQADGQGWQSPQLLASAEAVVKDSQSLLPPPEVTRKRQQMLADLKRRWDSAALLKLIPENGPPLEVADNALVQANTTNTPQNAEAYAKNEYEKRRIYNNRVKQDTYQSQAQQQMVRQPPVREKTIVRISRQMVPMWLTKDGAPQRLVILRRVQIGSRPICQGMVIDWPRLQQVLAEQIHDLFPDARFIAMREATPPRPERTMTALPIELDPGPAAAVPASTGWSPLRIGLAIAWSAVLVALTAVALGGWSLFNLGERRSRFVSAVTHELRTPLTTLRLYLDMLTSGMVREEQQKAEYLQTLHTEADRLNRLIGNVLDFSRLENQRPRLEKTPIALAELLEQLRSTWQARCQSTGKELMIDNPAGDLTINTDVHLLQQILGNLIDNACKYSRCAEDRRIWIRARSEDRRLVIEVEDRGPGIPARERRLIFSPFGRGRGADETAGGVGLGLALARRWARLLGGKLSLQPSAGKSGACFQLELRRD
jgi:signal transduction histidine kinase